MNGRERMRRAGEQAGKRYGEHDSFDAYLSRGDGTGTVIVDAASQPGVVWCYRDVQGVREAFTATIHPDSEIPYQNNPSFEASRIPVRCFRKGRNPILWVSGGENDESKQATGGVSLTQQLITYVQNPTTGNLTDARIFPTNPASTSVQVAPFWYVKESTGDEILKAQTTVSLASQIAALTSGQHQFAAVYFNTETATFSVLTNTAETGTDKDIFDGGTLDALTPASGLIFMGAVHSFYGQTTLQEDGTRSDYYRNLDAARFPLRGVRVAGATVAITNTANPPTDAQLTTAFGSVGDGFVGVLDDNGAGVDVYLVVRRDTNWWYTSLTKAT